MTTEQFIEKWNVGYESKENRAELAKEMKADLEVFTKENKRLREAEKVAIKLAEWSLKYPRGRIYSMSNQSMDAKLIEIENEAKNYFQSLTESEVKGE